MATMHHLIEGNGIADTLGKPMHRRSLLKSLAGIGAAAIAVKTIGPAAANHTEQTYTVSSNANFRSGPGANYSLIGVVTTGATFQINGQVQNGYAGIIYQGKTGWVLASLVVEAGGGGGGTPTITGQGWTTASVKLRSGPGTTYTVLKVVPGGVKIGTSTTVKNGFRFVTDGSQAGWMSDAYISAINPGDPAGDYATTTANVNFRTEPSANSPIIQVIPAGSKVLLLHVNSGDYTKVAFNGKQGWVHRNYIKL